MIKTLKEKWNKVPLAVKVSAAYAVCSVLQKCLSFVTLPLFTRLLTTEQYGQYTIYSSWSGILTIFLTLNLGDEYIASIQGICMILCCVFLAAYLPLRGLWNQLFELPTFFVLLLVAEIVFSTATQLWMGKKRF